MSATSLAEQIGSMTQAYWGQQDGMDRCARGRAKHAQVTADRWCVTREDLESFLEEVRAFHVSGNIPNDVHPKTGKPNPFHDDMRVGPNIHTVNKYVIKPITLERGDGASWALMQHEDGIPVDFFVTHNWQEGIYEFCRKVTMSWPTGLQHMWCCFLANPQAWAVEDLKQLIGSESDLSDSPFAMALSSPACQMMLVVPNSCESIYVRLWCVEEARRSIDLQIPVWVATDCGILHWPLGCKSVDDATQLVRSNSLRRLNAWSSETSEAKDSAEEQLAGSFVSVSAAHCTDADDEQRIRASMAGQEANIDSMIHDLASKGHWLPRGRRVSKCSIESESPMPSPSGSPLPSPLPSPRGERVLGLGGFLSAAKLQRYYKAAEEWCMASGVVEVSALHAHVDQIAHDLSLKKLERVRLMKAVMDIKSPLVSLKEPTLSTASTTCSGIRAYRSSNTMDSIPETVSRESSLRW